MPEQISKYRIIILKVIFMQKKEIVISFECVTEHVYEKHWQNGVKYFQDSAVEWEGQKGFGLGFGGGT